MDKVCSESQRLLSGNCQMSLLVFTPTPVAVCYTETFAHYLTLNFRHYPCCRAAVLPCCPGAHSWPTGPGLAIPMSSRSPWRPSATITGCRLLPAGSSVPSESMPPRCFSVHPASHGTPCGPWPKARRGPRRRGRLDPSSPFMARRHKDGVLDAIGNLAEPGPVEAAILDHDSRAIDRR